MSRDRLPARRESLHASEGDAAGAVAPRPQRRPKTYARKRARAEADSRAAARSAEVSLDTRNCGEGRVSLAPAQTPPSPVASGSESEYEEEQPRRRGAKKRAAKGTKRAPLADMPSKEQKGLDEFLAQQKEFWSEVDGLELVEEEDA